MLCAHPPCRRRRRPWTQFRGGRTDGLPLLVVEEEEEGDEKLPAEEEEEEEEERRPWRRSRRQAGCR